MVIQMSKIGEAKKKILHFYCYTCKAYELKTSPHYRSQKRRFAKRHKIQQSLDPHYSESCDEINRQKAQQSIT
jgi:hypothetical protein